MPIPTPQKKTESKQDFISRCMGDKVMNDDYDDQKQRAAVCYSQWEKHKKGKQAKSGISLFVNDDEILVFAADDEKDTSDKTPSYEEDPDAPKLTPGIKPVSPKSSQPKSGDDDSDKDSGDSPDSKPKETEDDGDSPDTYDETDVQASLDTRSEAPTKLSTPENWECIRDLGTKDFCVWAGANDWEDTWSAVAFIFNNHEIGRHTTRVWGHILPQIVAGDKADPDHGKKVVQRWLKGAKGIRDGEQVTTHRPKHFVEAATKLGGLRGYGVEKVQWHAAEAVKKPERTKTINKRLKTASNPPDDQMPNPDKKGATNPDNQTAPNASPNSYDQGKKPSLSKMPWFMGSADPRYSEMKAKWPLTFQKIERDFKRPNKPGNPGQEPKAQDSQKPATEEEPYQTTTK